MEDIKNVKVETKVEEKKEIVCNNTDKDIEIAKLNYRINILTKALEEKMWIILKFKNNNKYNYYNIIKNTIISIEFFEKSSSGFRMLRIGGECVDLVSLTFNAKTLFVVFGQLC